MGYRPYRLTSLKKLEEFLEAGDFRERPANVDIGFALEAAAMGTIAFATRHPKDDFLLIVYKNSFRAKNDDTILTRLRSEKGFWKRIRDAENIYGLVLCEEYSVDETVEDGSKTRKFLKNHRFELKFVDVPNGDPRDVPIKMKSEDLGS